MKTLLIDDEKDPVTDPLLVTLGPIHSIARNYVEGIAMLVSERPDRLLLDHDLADFSGEDGEELTGRSVIRWLARPENRQYIPGTVICVSRNTVGKSNIEADVKLLYTNPDALVSDPQKLQSAYDELWGS